MTTQYEYHRHKIAPGWEEIRVVVQRAPEYETADFEADLTGDAARLKISKWFLSNAAGVCTAANKKGLATQLRRLWTRIEAAAGIDQSTIG